MYISTIYALEKQDYPTASSRYHRISAVHLIYIQLSLFIHPYFLAEEYNIREAPHGSCGKLKGGFSGK